VSALQFKWLYFAVERRKPAQSRDENGRGDWIADLQSCKSAEVRDGRLVLSLRYLKFTPQMLRVLLEPALMEAPPRMSGAASIQNLSDRAGI
jgi:hypothetical protein